MKEKVKAYLEKAKEFLKKVPKKIYIALVVVVAAALAAVIWLNTRPYEVLFTGLNSTDMASIVSYMEESGVTDYKVQNNDTILVPPSQEDSLRARLLMEGYPTSGFSYVTAETGALSTESERTQAVLNALQESMSSTIRAFNNVKDAIVYINTGEDRSYVLDSNNVVEASATVVVEMREGTRLSSDEAAAIRRLVAYAVAGLDISNVTIEDTIGNSYSDIDSLADSEASALKLQLEEDYANNIRTKVVQALSPFFGAENVRVSVSCTVDINQTVTESTDYYLPEYAEDGSTYGRGIVGSRIFSYVYERDAEETTGGLVGTETNSDIEEDFSEYVEDYPELTGNESYVDISGQTDYVTSNSKKQIVQTAGYLTDCSVSVSINSTVAGAIDLDRYAVHVARAAGIEGVYDEDGVEHLEQYISVVSAPFFVEVDDTPEKTPWYSVLGLELWMVYAAAGGLILFLILLLIILLLIRRKKKKKKKKQEEQQARDMEAFLAAAAAATQAPQTGADVMSMQSEKSIELRKDIRKFAEENPEIAAQMLKSWLRGDEDNG